MIVVQALLMLGVRASEIRTYPLDDRSVYTVRLNPAEPTTCVFPGPIRALIGANVSEKPDDNPGVLLAHSAGAEYFSLRLRKEDVVAALNILFRGRVYALRLVGAPEPDRAVVFLDQPLSGGTGQRLPSDALRGLLERAKHEQRRAPAAGMASSLEHAEPRTLTAYRGFSATIESVTRFEAEDVLVFRVRLDNATDAPVRYDVAGLAVRLDREFFPAALADASGAIPPQGASLVYLIIAGAPGGGRANLPVQAEYSVIVPTS
jgi:hypothetical protein